MESNLIVLIGELDGLLEESLNLYWKEHELARLRMQLEKRIMEASQNLRKALEGGICSPSRK